MIGARLSELWQASATAVDRLLDAARDGQYLEQVISVNTARMHGKLRRHGAAIAHRPDWKKAYVKLAEGSAIELF